MGGVHVLCITFDNYVRPASLQPRINLSGRAAKAAYKGKLF